MMLRCVVISVTVCVEMEPPWKNRSTFPVLTVPSWFGTMKHGQFRGSCSNHNPLPKLMPAAAGVSSVSCERRQEDADRSCNASAPAKGACRHRIRLPPLSKCAPCTGSSADNSLAVAAFESNQPLITCKLERLPPLATSMSLYFTLYNDACVI